MDEGAINETECTSRGKGVFEIVRVGNRTNFVSPLTRIIIYRYCQYGRRRYIKTYE